MTYKEAHEKYILTRTTQDSIHEFENPDLCTKDHYYEKCILCDNEWDVLECTRCGRQRITCCTFNEEYS